VAVAVVAAIQQNSEGVGVLLAVAVVDMPQ